MEPEVPLVAVAKVEPEVLVLNQLLLQELPMIHPLPSVELVELVELVETLLLMVPLEKVAVQVELAAALVLVILGRRDKMETYRTTLHIKEMQDNQERTVNQGPLVNQVVQVIQEPLDSQDKMEQSVLLLRL